MVNMLNLNQAALPSIQLVFIYQVFTGHCINDQRDILVFSGESVTLSCNASEEKTTQINWTKDRFSFVHSIQLNKTSSNLTSNRLTIDLNLPLKLNVINATHEDAGLYTCTVVGVGTGLRTTEWNMTVSEAPVGVSSSWDVLYILTSVIGLLLCVIATAVCLCRKLRTQNQNISVQDQLDLQSAEEVTRSRTQADPDRRTHNKHRSQYMERLNSIYGEI